MAHEEETTEIEICEFQTVLQPATANRCCVNATSTQAAFVILHHDVQQTNHWTDDRDSFVPDPDRPDRSLIRPIGQLTSQQGLSRLRGTM